MIEHDEEQSSRTAESDHTRWLDEIGQWRVDNHRALARLAAVMGAIHERDAEIERHAEQIRRFDAEMAQHEIATAMRDRTDHGTVHEQLRRLHEELASTHLSTRRRHERLKREHDAIMLRLEALDPILHPDHDG